MEIKEVRVPSFGEQLIGVDINSTEENIETKINKLFAEVAEIMKKNYSDNHKYPVKSLLFDHAVGEIVNAQQSVIKVLTYKHFTEDEING